MPRLFTALEIPDDVREQLSLLRGGLPGARWIDAENYHITLRFVGEAWRDRSDPQAPQAIGLNPQNGIFGSAASPARVIHLTDSSDHRRPDTVEVAVRGDLPLVLRGLSERMAPTGTAAAPVRTSRSASTLRLGAASSPASRISKHALTGMQA